MKLNSHQLRKSRVGESAKKQRLISRNPLVLVLDRILDTYNIGSFFRLGDALAVEKIYLCGPCVTPPNIKIHRASIGTWKWTPWQHFQNTQDCLTYLKKQGYQIVAAEQNHRSQDFRRLKYTSPTALILGSETEGISPDILKQIDKIAEIPMYGVNISLNVLVAASVIGFEIVHQLKKSK